VQRFGLGHCAVVKRGVQLGCFVPLAPSLRASQLFHLSSVVPFEGTHRLGLSVRLGRSRLVEVASGRSEGVGHVPAYHLGGEARELAWSRDVPCTNRVQERGWAGVPQGRVDELDVA
jgi:hypothetical protein